MVEPSSFCCISTIGCANELVGLLCSLSIHNTNAIIYCMVDSKTANILNELSSQIYLDIRIINTLDKYSGKNRPQMEKEGIWSDFQMMKAEVIRETLKEQEDTFFLDADIFVLDKLLIPDKTKDIGVSPHYIPKQITDIYGYYNGGMIWVKNKNIPDDWIKFTKTSRYFDQASIEDLANKYSHFIFNRQYNFGLFRISYNKNTINDLKIHKNKICFKKKPIKCIHIHFTNKNHFKNFGNIIINLLKESNKYKELICIERIIKDCWYITIPKQPISGMYNHVNDTFRELAPLYSKHHKTFKCFPYKSTQCWFMLPHILLYDRPTLRWCNDEIKNASLILLGNCSETEAEELSNKYNIPVKPWIFWPRKPSLVEKIIDENINLSWDERIHESTFMGGYTTKVQLEFRDPVKLGWDKVITNFYFIKGNNYKYTHEEYLKELRKSKYGLCLRGFGKKCNREMELLAMGTVPIITADVSLYFNDPLIENKHYIRIDNPNDYKNKIDSITKEQWTEMSNNCKKWYMKNIHSKNGLNELIKQILYN